MIVPVGETFSGEEISIYLFTLLFFHKDSEYYHWSEDLRRFSLRGYLSVSISICLWGQNQTLYREEVFFRGGVFISPYTCRERGQIALYLPLFLPLQTPLYPSLLLFVSIDPSVPLRLCRPLQAPLCLCLDSIGKFFPRGKFLHYMLIKDFFGIFILTHFLWVPGNIVVISSAGDSNFLHQGRAYRECFCDRMER